VRHLSDQYLKDIEDIIESTTGKKYICEFIAEENVPETSDENLSLFNITRLNNIKKTTDNQLPLNLNYTFENFVIGPNNQLAHAAAKSVSRSPATQFNPLFIYGGTGLGKTHLIQAIGHYILKERPYLKVLYLPT